MSMSRNMQVITAALALVVASLGTTACSKKKDDAKTPAKPAEGEPQGRPTKIDAPVRADAAQMRARAQQMRATMLAVTVDEVKAFIPTLDGKVVTELAKAQVGEVVQQAWCFDQGEVGAIAEGIKTRLTDGGWQNANSRTMDKAPAGHERASVTAIRKPYMVFFSVNRGGRADCDATKGQTAVQMNITKRGEAPAGQVGPGGAPGPAGMVGPGVRPGMTRPVPVLPPAAPQATPADPE